MRQLDVLDDFQPEPGQADLLARRAQHAQLAEPEVGEDLAAGTVAAPFGQRATARGSDAAQGCSRMRASSASRVLRFAQQHQRTAALARDRGEHVAYRRPEVGAAPMQRVGQRILHVHAHQRRHRGVGLAAQQREVQGAAQAVAIGEQAERAVLGIDLAHVDALDRVLGGEAMADQVLDRADLQAVLAREHLQFRPPRHRCRRD